MKESFRNTLNILFVFNLLVIYGTCTKGWAFFWTHSVTEQQEEIIHVFSTLPHIVPLRDDGTA
jgi:hypothetical protein